jgi:hypothetical protein
MKHVKLFEESEEEIQDEEEKVESERFYIKKIKNFSTKQFLGHFDEFYTEFSKKDYDTVKYNMSPHDLIENYVNWLLKNK